MLVELRQHTGRNIATGLEETLPQYRLFVDGKPAGFIGWKARKLCLTTRFGPIELREIESEVERLLERGVESATVPDVPAEMLLSDEEQEALGDIDDLN